MFKLPEEFRLTKEVAEKNQRRVAQLNITLENLATEANTKSGGYFWLPRKGKKEGAYFLIRASVVDGWNCVAVTVPSESRPPTKEELLYIKLSFWNKEDIVAEYMDDKIFMGTPLWLHLWSPVDGWIHIPKFKDKLPQAGLIIRFRRFLKKLYKEVVKKLRTKPSL